MVQTAYHYAFICCWNINIYFPENGFRNTCHKPLQGSNSHSTAPIHPGMDISTSNNHSRPHPGMDQINRCSNNISNSHPVMNGNHANSHPGMNGNAHAGTAEMNSNNGAMEEMNGMETSSVPVSPDALQRARASLADPSPLNVYGHLPSHVQVCYFLFCLDSTGIKKLWTILQRW